MNDDREWFWDSRVRNRGNRLIQNWLFRCLALATLAALWCVPAAAQCDAYVVQNGSNSVWVVNTKTDALVAVIPVQFSPLGVAITPNAAFAYVANFNSSSVSVIDTATNTVTATVGVGTGPSGVAITPNGAFAYVTNYYSNVVSVIKKANNTVVGTVAVGRGPR